MRYRRATACSLLAAVALGWLGAPARAQPDLGPRVVVFTLPGVTWHDVARGGATEILAAVSDGAAGSVAVRTNSSRTTYASGFATIGGGTRLDATVSAAAARPAGPERDGFGAWEVPGVETIEELAAAQGYSTARAGALADAVGPGRVVAAGNSAPGPAPLGPTGPLHPVLLAAMDGRGRAIAAAGDELLESDPGAPYGVRTNAGALLSAVAAALERPAAVVVVDPGDTLRADRWAAAEGEAAGSAREDALIAADDLLGEVRSLLAPQDLLLVVSPTSPASLPDVHFGVAVAVGPGFEPGSTLVSASTRRDGIVTLPDVAPTVLRHLGIELPGSMLGRPWLARPFEGDLVAAARDLDSEAVFIDRIRTPVSTVFVLAQLALYAVTVWVLLRRDRGAREPRRRRRWLEVCGLALAAFPLATYLAGVVQGHAWGGLAYSILLVGLDVAAVAVAVVAARDPFDRLLWIAGATLALLIADLLAGAPLQLNTVFSYSPIVAGRFAGIGNIGFAILAACSVLTGTLIVHRAGARPRVLAIVAAIFVVTVVVDGAPRFGSDVGGAIALTAGLGLTLLLLSGRGLDAKTVAVLGLATVLVLGAFLAVDLARPSEERTHLGRLVESIQDEGFQAFTDTITRKVRTNLRVARSTIWTFIVPAALALVAWLLFFPRGRWEEIARSLPKVRAGLVSGAVVAVLGFAVNDSGIVIPAMMFAYLVPVALCVYLTQARRA